MHLDEYRKMAESEDRMWYFLALHRHLRWCLGNRLQLRKADVLDAGCGSGGFLRRLRETRPQWTLTGIDFSPLACELARQRCDVRIEQASVTALPFADASFDAVVSADVICQVEDAAAALAEFFRCLRPGGIVVVTVPAYRWLWSYHDDTVHTKHRYTRRELVGLLTAAGFFVGLNTHWNMLPFPLLVLRRKVFPPRDPTSDVRLYPAPLETMFGVMMNLEHAWLRAGWTLPYGSSVLAVGRKPGG
jgi:SAM-dependent methyltransferase